MCCLCVLLLLPVRVAAADSLAHPAPLPPPHTKTHIHTRAHAPPPPFQAITKLAGEFGVSAESMLKNEMLMDRIAGYHVHVGTAAKSTALKNGQSLVSAAATSLHTSGLLSSSYAWSNTTHAPHSVTNSAWRMAATEGQNLWGAP